MPHHPLDGPVFQIFQPWCYGYRLHPNFESKGVDRSKGVKTLVFTFQVESYRLFSDVLWLVPPGFWPRSTSLWVHAPSCSTSNLIWFNWYLPFILVYIHLYRYSSNLLNIPGALLVRMDPIYSDEQCAKPSVIPYFTVWLTGIQD